MPEEKQFDLTPNPRILPLLGEINLQQWRCLAELVDNSIDSFIEAARSGHPINRPQVHLDIPTTATRRDAQLTLRDNGPGMDRDTLEKAARAGWTSHDPINNLGLFGMGFNIATARLGQRTTIWTTRSTDREWVGLEIDFEKLIKRQVFLTPALSRPKNEASISGTEIIIGRLKVEQLEWFAKVQNRTNVSRQFGKVYSSMLGPAKQPIGFRLEINSVQVMPKLHCIWGGPDNPERSSETAKCGTVNAFQPFDSRMDPRPFCTQCWNWLGVGQSSCPDCGREANVVLRERRVHGWIGIQRHTDETNYGIDLLRNGRKIEIGNKDLFRWYNESSDTWELEYPIDDPRFGGRIVGEVHIDHCRVPYTKDYFTREDLAWREMVEIIRGKTPLRPILASEMGMGENNSPLFRLYQAFRRSTIKNKKGGGYVKLLLVPDNSRAKEMAQHFDQNEAEYLTDQKWWDLVEEGEAEALQGGGAGGTGGPSGGSSPGGGGGTGGDVLGGDEIRQPPSITEAPRRSRIPSLSQQVIDDLTTQRFEVNAFSVEPNDPLLQATNSPWKLKRTTAGPWEFYVDLGSNAFRSITLTPLDALIVQLAWVAADFERGQGERHSFEAIYNSLRDKYARSLFLDARALVGDATSRLVDIARSIVGRISVEDSRAFFDELGASRQESIRVAMATRGLSTPRLAEDDGRFLQYASPTIIMEFVLKNPSLFFDNNYWDNPFETLDYGSATATGEARSRLLSYFGGLLSDVVWLAQHSPEELNDENRERLMRASLSTALLAPTAITSE